MLSSSARRAKESAEILSAKLNLTFELVDLLWSGPDDKVDGGDPDFRAVLDLISKHPNQAEVVVLITHFEYVENFPRFLGRNHLGGVCLPIREIPKGTAWLIDCEQKTMFHVN